MAFGRATGFIIVGMLLWSIRIGFLANYFTNDIEVYSCQILNVKKLYVYGDIIINTNVNVFDGKENFETTIHEICDNEFKCNDIIHENWRVDEYVPCSRRVTNILMDEKSKYTRTDLTPGIKDILEFTFFGIFATVFILILSFICYAGNGQCVGIGIGSWRRKVGSLATRLA